MILLVNDADILIDLLKIGLLVPFMQLPCEFFVTDLVVAEVMTGSIADLNRVIADGSMQKRGFTFEELQRIQQIKTEYPVLSIPDCSCLFVARTLSATLLTGDAALRKKAEQNKIPVHGILWIFDELVDRGIIRKDQAQNKLKYLVKKNPRLPSDACETRLKKWNRGK